MKLDSRLNPQGFDILTPESAREHLSDIDIFNSMINDIINCNSDDINTKIHEFHDKLTSVSIDKIKNIINIISENMINKSFDNDYKIILRFVLIINIIKRDLDSRCKSSDNTYLDIISALSKVMNIINEKFYNINNDSSKEYMYIKTYIDDINNFICKETNKVANNSNYEHKFISAVDINNDINSCLDESCEYIKKFYNETDDDYLIAYIKKLPDFVNNIIDQPNSLNIIKNICNYYYNRLLNNITAIEIFDEVLIKVSNIIHNKNELVGDNSYEPHIMFIVDFSETLFNRKHTLKDMMNSGMGCDHSPLFEMGFGYIYDIIPSNEDDVNSSTIDNIGKAMVEAANEYEVLNIMTEAFGRQTRSEMIQSAKDDIAQRKVYDRYSDRRRASDDRYSRKMRRKDDKYSDFRSDEEYERQQKREEKERKKNQTKTAWAKWKTMELTSPTVFSASRALKRLVSATAVGGVAYAAGFNPVFLPIIYLISRYMKDKANPQRTKVKLMQDIEHTTHIIEAKIDQAERQGDTKQKYELMRMKDKLDSQFKRMGFSLGTGGVVR